jgi:hypothetical protein
MFSAIGAWINDGRYWAVFLIYASELAAIASFAVVFTRLGRHRASSRECALPSVEPRARAMRALMLLVAPTAAMLVVIAHAWVVMSIAVHIEPQPGEGFQLDTLVEENVGQGALAEVFIAACVWYRAVKRYRAQSRQHNR